MRRRITYANVTATLALVLAMSGGALAAKHYLINSTKQISPKVLKALKGKTGRTGPTGPAGSAGALGKEGTPGKEGAKGEPGPSHAYSAAGGTTATVTVPAGTYAVTGDGSFADFGAKVGAGFCALDAAGKTLDFRWASVPNTGEEETFEKRVYGEMNIANQGTVQLPAGGKITERCQEGEESQETVSVEKTVVTAIQVGALN